MTIREATCHTCGYRFNEAQAEWDHAWTTGRCPKCRRFLDPSREVEALKRSGEATTNYRAIAERRRRIFAALGIVAPGILLYILDIRAPGVVLMFLGVTLLVRALLHTTSEQAHQDLERETDLEDFTDEPGDEKDREQSHNPAPAADV